MKVNTITRAATMITREHRKVISRGQFTGGSSKPPSLGASRLPPLGRGA